MFKTYYRLTKPGIIYGNALTAIAGFFLAAQAPFDWLLFGAMIMSLCLIIASACVCNNYFDRDIDALMERTEKRALVQKTISTRSTLLFAGVLLSLGIVVGLFTNPLCLGAALLGFVLYIFAYTPLKRVSVYSTHVGALAGAMPPVVGYTAVSNSLDGTAVLLFIILALWQMPHFFAIALYRRHEYAAAKLPILSVVKGVVRTKTEIILYASLFVVASLALWHVASLNLLYLLTMLLLGLCWLVYAALGFTAKNTTNTDLWAKKMFRLSLIVLLTWSLLLMTQ